MLFNSSKLFDHVFIFLIIHSYFLILTVITQIFNATPELVIPTGIMTTEWQADMQALSVKLEAKRNKCLI